MRDRYQNLRAAWLLPCPNLETDAETRLYHFRDLEVMPGPASPPVHLVHYFCTECLETHRALLTSRDLDWAPVMDPLPVYHDLLTGNANWDPGALYNVWTSRILKGDWPLKLHCSSCGSLPTWPSRLQHIEPWREQYAVTASCAQCEQLQMQIYNQMQMTYSPF